MTGDQTTPVRLIVGTAGQPQHGRAIRKPNDLPSLSFHRMWERRGDGVPRRRLFYQTECFFRVVVLTTCAGATSGLPKR